MRKVKRYFSGIIAMLLLVASIPLNVFGATTLAITSQPTPQTVVEGKTVTFSVTATGAKSYQWQTYSNSKWNNLSWTGATTNKMTFTSDTKYSGKKFRCVISDENNNKIATDTVVFKALTIKSQPTTQYVIEGKTVTFSVDAPGAASYQWQTYNNSKWTNLSWTGATTNKMTFTSAAKYSGKKFRCVISDGKNKIATDTVVFRTLSIKKQPSSQSVVLGETVELSIDAPGATSYQWQTYNGSKWANLGWTGATTSKMTFTSDYKYSGKTFRCVVKDTAGNSVASEVVSFDVLAYTITYDAGEGLFDNDSRFMTNKENPGWVEFGPFYPNGEKAVPVWQDHILKGWKYNGRLVRSLNVSSDITLEAEWADECIIRYNLAGGHLSDETASFAAEMGYTMEGDILKETVAPGTYFIPGWIEPQKEGYIFKGWKYQSAYMRSATVNSTHRTIELMADWEEAALVTLDANGGYWFFDEEEGPFETYSFYQPKGTYYINWHQPQREKYYFYGWIDANGRNKVKVNLTGDATFRALWYPAYNVVYHGNGGQFDEEEYHGDWDYWPGDRCNYNGKNYECISEVHRNDPWDPEKWEEIELIEDMVREERGGNYHVGSVQNPYREGYHFMGWSGIPTAPRGEWGWDIPLQADMEFYAIWVKEDIKVTMDANGGLIPQRNDETNEDEYFETVIRDYDPWNGVETLWAERGEGEEYNLLGWSKDKNATEPQYGIHDWVYVEDTCTLYAVWEKRAAIVFDGNGGTWTWKEKDEATGAEIECSSETRTEYREDGQFYYVRTWNPELEGYRFDGWLDKDGNPVDDSQYIVLDKDEEYYFTAIWIKTIVVTYDSNDGDWGEDENHELVTEKYWEGDSGEVHIGMEWPHRDDYAFVGWSLDPDADPATDEIETDFDVELDEDATYYAIWCASFEVTYDANGVVFWYDGDNPITEEVDHNINYGEFELRDRYYVEGYEFLGWDEDPNATEPTYGPRERIFIKGETTFYAIWHKYPTITYSAAGGLWTWEEWREGENEQPGENVQCSTEVKTDWRNDGEYYYVGMDEPHREGYEFAGWVDDEGNNVDNMLITMDQDYEFFASWKKRINVRYYANGGQFFEWDDENQVNVPIGKEIDRDAKTGEEYYLDGWQPEKPGYRFVGWAYEQDATEEDIIENPLIFELEDFEDVDEIELCAVWRKVVDITYDFNGGTCHGQDYETMFDICEPGEFGVGWEWPYREGYEFLGWSDDPDAEDAEPNFTCILSEVATYQDNGEENATVTFYAIWDQKMVVTFDAGEGEFDNGEQIINQYFRIGDILDWDRDFGTEEPINLWPTREGYRFVGWTFNGEDFKLIRIDEDITVVAKWVEVKTVTLDANGGTVWDEDGNPGEVIHITNNVDCTLPACDFEPFKEGVEFLGWYDSNDELVNYITFEDSYTLTARWSGEGEEIPDRPPHNWGVTECEIHVNGNTEGVTINTGDNFIINNSITGNASTVIWYISSDQNNWTQVGDDFYNLEQLLDVPGTYYYKMTADGVESNILIVTIKAREY